jgi:hypothetical protein
MSLLPWRLFGVLSFGQGLWMLFNREKAAQKAARQNVRVATALPFLSPRSSKSMEHQLRMWKVLVIPMGVFFILFGLLLMIDPTF